MPRVVHRCAVEFVGQSPSGRSSLPESPLGLPLASFWFGCAKENVSAREAGWSAPIAWRGYLLASPYPLVDAVQLVNQNVAVTRLVLNAV